MGLNKSLYSSESSEWETPTDFFEELNAKYKFTLDPCCTKKSAKCKKFYTKKENGLIQSWRGERVFMNPPYGQEISQWVKKAWTEFYTHDRVFIVALLPARTDTKWFHDYIYRIAQIEFIKGRLKFGDSKNSAPFPSMLVSWGMDY